MVHTRLNKDNMQLDTTPTKLAEEKETLTRIVRIGLAEQNWILSTAELLLD